MVYGGSTYTHFICCARDYGMRYSIYMHTHTCQYAGTLSEKAMYNGRGTLLLWHCDTLTISCILRLVYHLFSSTYWHDVGRVGNHYDIMYIYKCLVDCACKLVLCTYVLVIAHMYLWGTCTFVSHVLCTHIIMYMNLSVINIKITCKLHKIHACMHVQMPSRLCM